MNLNLLLWRYASVSITHNLRDLLMAPWSLSATRHRITHEQNTVVDLINLWQKSAAPSPLCILWAAGWWESVRSLFSQDKEVETGCLCTPGQPSWLCPGSVCWGYAPSTYNRSTGSQTGERGPWRALGPDPFPEEAKSQAMTSHQLRETQCETAVTNRQPKTGHFHCLLISVSLFGIINQLGEIKRESTDRQSCVG